MATTPLATKTMPVRDSSRPAGGGAGSFGGSGEVSPLLDLTALFFMCICPVGRVAYARAPEAALWLVSSVEFAALGSLMARECAELCRHAVARPNIWLLLGRSVARQTKGGGSRGWCVRRAWLAGRAEALDACVWSVPADVTSREATTARRAEGDHSWPSASRWPARWRERVTHSTAGAGRSTGMDTGGAASRLGA